MKGTLFTTSSCPKCPAFKLFLRQHVPFPIDVLDEKDASFRDLIGKYGVSAAPTLIIENGQGHEMLRTSEQSEVIQFLKEKSLIAA